MSAEDAVLDSTSLVYFNAIVATFLKEPVMWFEVHKVQQSSVLAFIFVHLTSPFIEARASSLHLADALSSMKDSHLSPGFPLCLTPAPDMAMSARYALRFLKAFSLCFLGSQAAFNHLY